MKYLYIVAAAGTGKRMGMKKPKQFLEYGNEPIFIKTLKVIEKSKNNSQKQGNNKPPVEQFGSDKNTKEYKK